MSASKDVYYAEKEKELNSKYDDFEKLSASKDVYYAEKEKELNSKYDDFEKLSASKDVYYAEKEKGLNSKYDDFLKKQSLINIKEKELEEIFSNPRFKFFSKFINKNPKISIIVPVYNAGLYLRQCLDSLVNQTLYDIEVICMNDGSTDDSLEILKEYEMKDNRFKIFSQKNQGQGVARNKCLDKASGEFIMFLDSDDWLDENACKILYENAKLNNLDMLMFLIINYSEESGEFYEDNYYNLSCLDDKFENSIFNYEDLGELVFSISVSPCQKIYKKEILDDVRFAENIFFEDNPFYWDAIFSANRISLIKEHLYLRRRHDSSTTAKHNYKFLDIISISNMVINVFRKHNLIDYFRKRLSEYKIIYLKQWYNLLDEDTKYDFWKLMQKDFLKIKEDITIHEQFINCLSQNSKEFYLYALESRSPEELEYLLKYKNVVS